MNEVDKLIDEIIRIEGGYTDDPDDPGGKTKFGITEKVARENGYTGDMKDLTVDFAHRVYYNQYVVAPKFDRVAQIAGNKIAAELVDTGVNCGQPTASKMLQRSLNSLNNCEKLWPNLVEDGGLGEKSFAALASYMKARGSDAEKVLFAALNCLQGTHYMDISARNETQEKFMFGWFLNRIANQLCL